MEFKNLKIWKVSGDFLKIGSATPIIHFCN